MRRQGVRRAVVLLPNGLTLFNLFCGIYAIILAIRGDFPAAPAFIVLGGIADMLDGRVARATGTGSKFGEELDSLVDAVSFGFAPALIMYLGLPDHGTLEWLLVFMFTSCAVMRLARFNVEQAGRSKTHFHGLPSPAAGLTLATYYWFSQTPLYNKAIILFTDSKTLSDLPWPTLMRWLMAILAALMISEVPYPTVPSIGFRSVRQVLGTIIVSGCVVLLLVRREEFIFPALLAYVVFGVVKWFVLGLIGRSRTPDEIFWEEDEEEDDQTRDDRSAALARQSGVAVSMPGTTESRREVQRDERRLDERRPNDDSQAARRKRRRRSHRGPRPPGSSSPDLTLPPPSPDTPTGSSE
jgi:CDP-diacylglycerol---serine O-phosphatidyltransferase